MRQPTRVSGLRRVLVIDDDADLAALISEFAAQMGCETETACGKREIETALDAFRPQVVVLDLMMPETDGVEVLRYMADRGLRSGIIISSGGEPRVLDVTTRLARSLDLNLIGALAKPVSLDDLESMLQRALGIRPEVSETDLRQALGAGEIVPYFQPKVAVTDPERIVGAEVLARWRHVDRGTLAPYDFIGAAERIGLISELTFIVLEAALEATSGAGLTVPLSVNLSPASLPNRELPDELERRCHAGGRDPASVIFEITEGVASRDFADVMAALTRLRLKGFSLSMDDYGTGYSSLVHLVRLPFSELKIDRSFVSEIGEGRDSEIVVRSTISMAHSMGLSVCAEGVDDPRIIDFLQAEGCDSMQGYLVGHPVPIGEFPLASASGPALAPHAGRPGPS